VPAVRTLLRGALALALGAALVAAPAGASPGGEGGCRPWRAVPVPPADGGLDGISGTSSTDVWAVGQMLKPRILHWNGAWWHEAPQDNPIQDGLFDVKAIAADDAWAAGYQNSGIDPLTMHWDGERWSVVLTPAPASSPILYGLDATASDDVWAVGSFALHWDGTHWTEVETADTGAISEVFYGISAVAPDDVWAVGYQLLESGDSDSLIEHWDGTAWTVVEAALPPVGEVSVLFEVSALSPTDAWAVGWYGDPFPSRPMVQHWDGMSWSLMQTPSYPGGATLLGVEVIASDDAWAVGGFATLEGNARPITLHWDGSSWTEFPAPNPDNVGLLTVTEVSPTQIWAAGGYSAGALGEQPFSIRSRGVCP
jgi:hypothetical protein